MASKYNLMVPFLMEAVEVSLDRLLFQKLADETQMSKPQEF